jgi:outer membrane protein assembly factor BamB
MEGIFPDVLDSAQAAPTMWAAHVPLPRAPMSTLLDAPPRPAPPRGPSRGGRHRRRRPRRLRGAWFALVAVLVIVGAAVLGWRAIAVGSRQAARRIHRPAAPATQGPSPLPSVVSPSLAPPTPAADAAVAGPINTAFQGLTTFRGNATRTYYGKGPLPRHPVVLWKYPASGGMCSTSTDNHGKRTWCGTGWTGQPNVIASKHGKKIEVRFGAYDGHYHFLDGRTGQPLRPDLVTGDLAKGSATSDPDGYPLYYGGSRDNFLRVVAMDRPTPTVLWSFDSIPQRGALWNNDWDGTPLVIGDYLLEGGENSWFYVIRLYRHYDSKHLVQVNPKVVMAVPGFDDQLLSDLGDHDVSIEGSPAFDPNTGVVYFANSGGLVQGWDIGKVLKGGTKYRRVFRFWDGDETDATAVIDPKGFLYVARHTSSNVPTRPQTRDHQIGSLVKLDPRKPNDPVEWSTQLGGFEPDGGILGTPALKDGVVYTTFTEGGWAAVSAKTGKVLSTTTLPGPTWMSPVPIGHQLLVGDCNGVLHDFDVSNPKHPKELWTVTLGGCLESTPAVWKGTIWLGSRDGAMYAIGDSNS